MLAGAQGMVEINTCVRGDIALQRAFGRRGCAEQSTIQDTFNHCTTTVAQMEQALDQIFIEHSSAFWHDYQAGLQLLDVDMSGLPCGKKAAYATKGYFNRQYHRHGRQLARVASGRSDEVVADALFAGNTQLEPVLERLMSVAERRLGLVEQCDADKRARTLVRLDAGGGGLAGCNWLLERGYQLLTRTIRASERHEWRRQLRSHPKIT